MLYHLFELFKDCDFPGHNLMNYLSFRAIMANVTALLISLLFGGKFIKWLKVRRIYDGGRLPEGVQQGERHLGLEDENTKKKTPTIDMNPES